MSTRRDFLHLTAAATALGALSGPAAAQETASNAGRPIPPVGNDVLRLVTFLPSSDSTPRVGVV
ncbi:twin-arginine translocation signal domain-containing protein [Methylobacterium sp. C25]|uniref:twin-arginine translocation signal domain-containing protein n=1 Tax=Methylobacterium sp. C25 TaxID=2721622 RepID=UPI003FA39124